jgi:hypothetical protein
MMRGQCACGHPVSGASLRALREAIGEHQDYGQHDGLAYCLSWAMLNSTKDRTKYQH